MFKAASFNVNSIRSRLNVVIDWINKEKPDVLCLQETKVEDSLFPAADFHSCGYNVAFRGQKSYNGVAIASPHHIEILGFDPPGFSDPGEARLIAALIKGVCVVNTYVPQGQSPSSEKFGHKISWIRGMREFFQRHFTPETALIWAGDFNVAPEPLDVYDPKRLFGSMGFHPEEHKALQFVKDWGFVDVFRQHVKEGKQYTFWDYRMPGGVKRNLGWRIDHIWATAPLALLSRRAWIDKEPRLKEKPSDHTVIAAEFDLPPGAGILGQNSE